MTRPEVIQLLKQIISEESGIAISEIADTDTFFNLGLDSIRCVFLLDKIENQLNIELNPLQLWDYPSIDTYADFLLQGVAHGK